jgi:hypothetical protein
VLLLYNSATKITGLRSHSADIEISADGDLRGNTVHKGDNESVRAPIEERNSSHLQGIAQKYLIDSLGCLGGDCDEVIRSKRDEPAVEASQEHQALQFLPWFRLGLEMGLEHARSIIGNSSVLQQGDISYWPKQSMTGEPRESGASLIFEQSSFGRSRSRSSTQRRRFMMKLLFCTGPCAFLIAAVAFRVVLSGRGDPQEAATEAPLPDNLDQDQITSQASLRDGDGRKVVLQKDRLSLEAQDSDGSMFPMIDGGKYFRLRGLPSGEDMQFCKEKHGSETYLKTSDGKFVILDEITGRLGTAAGNDDMGPPRGALKVDKHASADNDETSEGFDFIKREDSRAAFAPTKSSLFGTSHTLPAKLPGYVYSPLVSEDEGSDAGEEIVAEGKDRSHGEDADIAAGRNSKKSQRISRKLNARASI